VQQMIEFVRYATRTPSGHNTQPWRVSVKDDTIRIFPDFTRHLLVVDSDNRELYIRLGCALGNLIIAAKYACYDSKIEYFPAGEPNECLLVTMKRTNTVKDNNLFRAIPEWHSNQQGYIKQQIPLANLNQLESVPKETGVTSLSQKQDVQRRFRE